MNSYVLIRHTEFTYILPVSCNLPHITFTSNSQTSAAHTLQKPVGTVITQFNPVAQSGPTLHGPMDCSMLGFPVLHHLLELAQTHVHWVSDTIHYLIVCHPLLLLPSIFPNMRVFCNESALCIRWPKYWSFRLSISPPVNIKDWFPLGWTLKSLLQHHASKTSISQHSAFFMV